MASAGPTATHDYPRRCSMAWTVPVNWSCVSAARRSTRCSAIRPRQRLPEPCYTIAHSVSRMGGAAGSPTLGAICSCCRSLGGGRRAPGLLGEVGSCPEQTG